MVFNYGFETEATVCVRKRTKREEEEEWKTRKNVEELYVI